VEKVPACVSLKARECGDADLIREFRYCFFRLPPVLRARVEAKIDDIGSQLGSFPHHRLKRSDRFRARIGDYRIIYTFDLEQNKIHLLAIGHRREIYRGI
jgi:mRNA-degrading endonuclease RelE of RelBE toxin-antitoxin system